ncbi:MAG TPA: hypothetical protein DDW76_23740 [Cyanobacteria bacterium UBA11369]|nr:hypothetical protein [Cyanobacteria bacterium UBA11371]HBE30626.1 hypothetical protein [Cyanobacteria bacterium UBA11368]HBE51704.1 hypothetical protein [Cyanobacteria bacterium UBA11369]
MDSAPYLLSLIVYLLIAAKGLKAAAFCFQTILFLGLASQTLINFSYASHLSERFTSLSAPVIKVLLLTYLLPIGDR